MRASCAHAFGCVEWRMFLNQEQFEAHEARVCIVHGEELADARRPKRYYPDQYLATQQEMKQRFKDWPALLANTLK